MATTNLGVPTQELVFPAMTWRVILTRQLRTDLEKLGLHVSDGMVQRTVVRWMATHAPEGGSHATESQ
jgi:hypothetical protein